jgi:DNA-binding MarR family transcriptional regulator
MTAKVKLPLALRAAYLALHRATDAKFAAHGVTADQFVLLATLARGGQALNQRQLAQRMPSDPSTVRAMLVLLEKSGLVEREPYPGDARARTVSLTSAGKRKFRQLWRAGETIRSAMLRSLADKQAESLVRLLLHVADSLQSLRPGAATGASLVLSRHKEAS